MLDGMDIAKCGMRNRFSEPRAIVLKKYFPNIALAINLLPIVRKSCCSPNRME